jgi:Amt family ammonium transporter
LPSNQLLNRLLGIAIAWVFSIISTPILLKLVDLVVGLRVSTEHEQIGLDLSQHGEEGYEAAR